LEKEAHKKSGGVTKFADKLTWGGRTDALNRGPGRGGDWSYMGR